MPKPIFEEFKRIAALKGVPDVTEAEYAAHVNDKWSNDTAVRRVLNSRKKQVEDANKEIVNWTGFPLGGRDYIHKISGSDSYIDIEQARTQRITFLRDDGVLKELTQWGDFKGQHGRKSTIEVEITENQGETRTFIDNTVRKITIGDQKVSLAALLKKAVSVDDIAEGDRYNLVAVTGKVYGRFEGEPKWEAGSKIDTFPLNYNRAPTLFFVMKGDAGKVYLRVHLAPTKHAKPYITVPDFEGIAELNDPEQYNISFTGREVLVVGWLRKFEPQADVVYADLMATAIVPAEVSEGAGLQQDITKVPPKVQPKPPAAVPPSPPPAKTETPADTTKAAESKLKIAKDAVVEALNILGDDLTVLAFKEINTNLGLSDQILGAIIEAVKKERAGQ